MNHQESLFNLVGQSEEIIAANSPTTDDYVHRNDVDDIDTLSQVSMVYAGMVKAERIRGKALQAKLNQMLIAAYLMGKRSNERYNKDS